MINFRSRVEYLGEEKPIEATEFLKGFKGIVTGRELYTTTDDCTFAEVTFMDDGGTRLVNIANLKEI